MPNSICSHRIVSSVLDSMMALMILTNSRSISDMDTNRALQILLNLSIKLDQKLSPIVANLSNHGITHHLMAVHSQLSNIVYQKLLTRSVKIFHTFNQSLIQVELGKVGQVMGWVYQELVLPTLQKKVGIIKRLSNTISSE